MSVPEIDLALKLHVSQRYIGNMTRPTQKTERKTNKRTQYRFNLFNKSKF